jgi:hypothetical protein
MPKYPEVTVQLSDQNGNAFYILGACRKAARKAKVPDEEIKAFTNEAEEGDYNHLLQTCLKWFNII